MQDYTVFFEIYGKKLKTTVQANDEIHAMEIVKSSISVIKVKKGTPVKVKENAHPFDDFEKYFEDMLDILNKKK